MGSVSKKSSRRRTGSSPVGEPSVPFCGEGGAGERTDGFFFAKGKKEAGAKRTLLRRGRGGQFRSPALTKGVTQHSQYMALTS